LHDAIREKRSGGAGQRSKGDTRAKRAIKYYPGSFVFLGSQKKKKKRNGPPKCVIGGEKRANDIWHTPPSKTSPRTAQPLEAREKRGGAVQLDWTHDGHKTGQK